MTGHHNEVHILVQLTFPCLGAGEPRTPDVAWIFGVTFLGYEPLAIQYTYIYVYIYIWIYIYTFIYVWINIYIWLCIHIYIYVCLYGWMDGCMHACMFLRYPWIPWFSIGSMIDSFSGPSHRHWWFLWKSRSETTSLKPKMGTSPNQHGHLKTTQQPSTGYPLVI